MSRFRVPTNKKQHNNNLTGYLMRSSLAPPNYVGSFQSLSLCGYVIIHQKRLLSLEESEREISMR